MSREDWNLELRAVKYITGFVGLKPEVTSTYQMACESKASKQKLNANGHFCYTDNI